MTNKRSYASLIFIIILASFSSVFFSNGTSKIISPNEELNNTTLTIVTRHDVTITNEFTSSFLATPEAQALNITDIDFRQSTTDQGWKTLLQDPAHSVDIAWGGGSYLFDTIAGLDLLYPVNPINDSELFNAMNNSVPNALAGTSMKRNDDFGNLLWVANTISSFGFIVNRDFLDTYDLRVPTTWSDLASPVYYINPSVKVISMGDPPLTTSNTRIYQIILQAYGWEEGWKILTRMAGNAAIHSGSVGVDPRPDITDDTFGVTMSIDFYGVIAQRENPSCEYIIPEDGTTIDGDPIALGINVDDYDAAVAFIKYVVSPEGQTTWLRPGLDRLPVNASAFDTPEGSLYTEMKQYYIDIMQSLNIDFNHTLAKANLDTTIYYFHNTITQKHILLRKVWGELVTQLRAENITTTEFTQLADQLGLPGMTLQESIDWNEQYRTDSSFASTKDTEWKNYATSQYNAILDLLRNIVTPTEPIKTTLKISSDCLLSLTSLILIPCLLRRRKKRQTNLKGLCF